MLGLMFGLIEIFTRFSLSFLVHPKLVPIVRKRLCLPIPGLLKECILVLSYSENSPEAAEITCGLFISASRETMTTDDMMQ